MNRRQRDIEKVCKSVTSLYESTKNAEGLAECNKALEKYGDVQEILGWKSLFCYCTGAREEADKLMMTAIRQDMKCGKIWKLNGYLQKEKNDYTKALQSFTQSYRLDQSDYTVLAELCNLQLYQRNIPKFLEHAKEYIKVVNSVGAVIRISLAYYLSGNEKAALMYLDNYEQNVVATDDLEEKTFRSEMRLYHAKLLVAMKRWQECVKYLTSPSKIEVFDKITATELLAQCYIEIGDMDMAVAVISRLIEEYPENGDYFVMLEKNMTQDEYMAKLMSIKGSKYAQVRILELMDVSDARFAGLLEAYLTPLLNKGTPFIYVTLRDLSNEKLDVAVKIAREAKVPVTYIPIVHLFVATVMHAKGEYTAALEELELGLKHTPTIVELVAMKVKVLNASGQLTKAREAAAHLAEMNPADRDTITSYTTALLKDGKYQTAIEVAEPWSILTDQKPRLMSNEYNDFHLKLADCCYDGGELEMAQKFYKDVTRHFNSYKQAEYNFLAFYIRCISSIFDMLSWADDLPKHPLLARALANIMKIAFIKKDLNPVEQFALRAIDSNDGSALAYACAFFAARNDPLPALKCYNKVTGSWKFACVECMNKLIESGLGGAPEVVKEVVTEEYKKFEAQPETFSDFVAAARGALFVGKTEQAKQFLLKAAVNFEYRFKAARDLYQIAKIEMNDAAFADEIALAINKKYEQYQLRVEFEKGPIPSECEYDSSL